LEDANHLILIGAALVAASVIVSAFASRFGTPLLLVFLALGMLAGEDGPGGIPFDDVQLTYLIGSVALGIILFDGGMRTHAQTVRVGIGPGVALATVGVAVTAGIVALSCVWFFGFTWLQGLLLGAIVGSTDAAAVFMMLRARNAKLPKSLSSLLEFESGSNDPMAVVLTLALIQLLAAPATAWWELLLFFVVQMTVGALFGVAMGEVTRWTLNTLKLENKGIYPVLTVAFALLTYGLAATLHGSGFLAVYLAGLVMRRKTVSHQRNLRQFHDGLAWLMQITMFLILGLQVFPARLVPIAGGGLLVSLFLIFVARPFSVYAALTFSRMSFREKTLVAWVGLRGAVPIVLATFPVLAGLRQADTIFHLVFFIALTSVLLQGPTIPWITQLLGLDRPPADVGPDRRLKTAVSPSS
jgi:potassium/hydrogen antiporter